MWKIFNSKKNNAEDINSWVFHKDIKEAFMKNYHKKLKKRMRLFYGFYIIFALLFSVLLSMYYESIIKGGLTVFCCVALGVFGETLLVKLASWLWKWRNVRKYWPLVVFPIIALAVVAVLVYVYPDSKGELHRSDVIGFCGDYLAFLGTFCLGYFVYVQDKAREIAKKREKVKLLYRLMEMANSELLRLSQLTGDKEYIKIQENRDRIEPITYDPNWIVYYCEYESLEGANHDLQQALKSFFDNVNRINAAIRTGQIETAERIHQTYLENEMYSTGKYNWLEALCCLLDACDDYHIIHTKSWIERQENIDLVNDLCRKYYYVIENYIYAWLLKHHVNSTGGNIDLQREVVDWLLAKSPEIKEKNGSLGDKRIVMQVVHDCSLKFGEKSKKIDYVWAEYSLR